MAKDVLRIMAWDPDWLKLGKHRAALFYYVTDEDGRIMVTCPCCGEQTDLRPILEESRVPEDFDLRRCPRCEYWYPRDAEHFYHSRTTKDGFTDYCKECQTAIGHERRAVARERGGSYTAKDIALIMRSQEGRCWWCQKELNGEFQVDHRIPLARGGSNEPNNLVLACPNCNRRKSKKMPHEWCGRLL